MASSRPLIGPRRGRAFSGQSRRRAIFPPSSKYRDRVAGRSGRTDDRHAGERVGEDSGLAFDEALEDHAFLQMEAVLHDESRQGWNASGSTAGTTSTARS